MPKLDRITISKDTAADLDAALGELKGRAKVFPDCLNLVHYAEYAEKRLESSGVPKTHRVGCTLTFREGGPSAKKYSYAKTVMTFELTRKAKGWVCTKAGNVDVYPQSPIIRTIRLTPPAKAAVIRHAMDGFADLPGAAWDKFVVEIA